MVLIPEASFSAWKTACSRQVWGIMTFVEILEEIPKLTLEEKLKLADALAADEAVAADNDAWDKQIKEDMEAGRLDFLFEEADAEYARGETEEWP